MAGSIGIKSEDADIENTSSEPPVKDFWQGFFMQREGMSKGFGGRVGATMAI